MLRTGLIVACALQCVAALGCVRRSIEITSDPPGALVWLNGREVGRTPVEVDFIYYGVYDVQLVADGYEPLLTTGKADPPLWDHVPMDFFAEVTPPQKRVRIAWHYELQPRDDDPQRLLERAHLLRNGVASEPPHAGEPNTSDGSVPPVQDHEPASGIAPGPGDDPSQPPQASHPPETRSHSR